MLAKLNHLGAVTSIALYVLYIVMFCLRLLGLSKYGHWLASLQFLSIIPFIYLLVKAPQFERPTFYFIQIGLMLFFLLIELFLDYIWIIEFRQIRWMVIIYVTLFFAATGGLLGIISKMENRVWIVVGIGIYLIMVALAFISRAVTGL